MRSRPNIIVILLSCLCGFAGCGKKDAIKLTSDQKKLVRVYVDLLEVREEISSREPSYLDSCRQILAYHHIEESDYKRVVSQLNQKPEQWETFYREVLAEMDRRKSISPANSP